MKTRALLKNVESSSGGENGINVGADGDVVTGSWLRVFADLSAATANAHDIAHFVHVDIVQLEFAEPFHQPAAALGLSEGRGRNARQFQLPLGELRFMRTKPIETLR
jgi:hypothetical protein